MGLLRGEQGSGKATVAGWLATWAGLVELLVDAATKGAKRDTKLFPG